MRTLVVFFGIILTVISGSRRSTLVNAFKTSTNKVRESTLKADFRSFEAFKKRFNKKYGGSTAEEIHRFNIFTQNLREIEYHNSQLIRNSTFKRGINQFSDLTQNEFEEGSFGYVNVRQNSGHSEGLYHSTHWADNDFLELSELPKHVDWREMGAITPVKNQGNCGSCWAHGAVETVESYLKIENPEVELMELSVQQVTSCAPNADHCGGTGGCYGSIPQLGFVYAQLYGLNTNDEYPYVSGNTSNSESCSFNPKTRPSKVTLRGYEILPRNDMRAFMKHLAYRGPLAISVAASDLKSYESGIYDACSFKNDIVMNHEIQLVGYGTDEKLGDYWLARNSWGPHWGEDGFIRFKRNDVAHCGYDRSTKDGSACENDGMTVQHVCGECGLLYEGVYPIGVAIKQKEF